MHEGTRQKPGALLSGSESEDIDPDDGVSSVSYNHVHLIITNNVITMTSKMAD